MYLFVAVVYCIVCAFLIFVVLLQQGRGGGMGSAFGGSSQTVFGGAGAGNVLTRITSVCAALFMVLSALLAYMSSSSDSTLEEVSRELEARQRADAISAERSDDPRAGDEQRAPARESGEDETGAAASEAAEGSEHEPGANAPAAPTPEEPAADEPAADEPTAPERSAQAPSPAPSPAAP